VLIVEDSDLYLKIYKKIGEVLELENIFCVKTIAESKKILGEKNINILILDLNLPDGNGRDLVSYIRDELKNQQIVIVTVSTEVNEPYIINLFDLGIDYYFEKPFNPGILKAVISRIMKRHEGED
jgi:DNA-binding response OmpR family regulator